MLWHRIRPLKCKGSKSTVNNKSLYIIKYNVYEVQLHSVLDVTSASSFCCGQFVLKALVVLLWLCSLHFVIGPYCRWQQKDSLPSIFLACKRFQRWGFLEIWFFFSSFFGGKKVGKHCCKEFWINCDCPPSHEVMVGHSESWDYCQIFISFLSLMAVPWDVYSGNDLLHSKREVIFIWIVLSFKT